MATLDLSWPPFLDSLTDNPKLAFEQFYREACELLRNHPPSPMRDLDQETRADLIQDIMLYCLGNDARVLASYRNSGRPFKSWFYAIACHRTLD